MSSAQLSEWMALWRLRADEGDERKRKDELRAEALKNMPRHVRGKRPGGARGRKG